MPAAARQLRRPQLRYGGIATTVQNYLGEPAINDLTATGGTSGWDVGYDRYMRQTRSLWKNGASSAVYYDSRPAYDDNSNITTVENAWITPFSAVYAPDALNRLEKATVGTLASGAIADSATLRQEDWTDKAAVKLSQTGNWSVFLAYRDNPSSAAEEQDQARTFLGRNEPNAVTDAVAGNPDPQYLVAHSGLVTRDDTTASSKHGYRYTYDAWGRLVKAADQDSNDTVAEYRYNGLGHRIGWKARFDTGQTYANNKWRYFQYNERWQQVGMYLETSAGANAVATNATETFLYHSSGLDGRGGSSYIDKVVFRNRDTNADGGRDEWRYYLQNWRNDVVALITPTGAWVERYRYDAYGRPESYSVADIAGSGGGGGGPNGVVSSTDSGAFSATGSADWNSDLGASGGSLVPDNVVNATDDLAAFNAYYTAGNNGGVGQISDTAIDNRKGLAGYEFDPILAADGAVDGYGVPLYHVRNRVLNSYTGKWMQKDPLGYHDGMDLYEYCQSDAVDQEDAWGLCCGKSASNMSASPISPPPAPKPAEPPPTSTQPIINPTWPDCFSLCDLRCTLLSEPLRTLCLQACRTGCLRVDYDDPKCFEFCAVRYDPLVLPGLYSSCMAFCENGPLLYYARYPQPSKGWQCILDCEFDGKAKLERCSEEYEQAKAAFRMCESWPHWSLNDCRQRRRMIEDELTICINSAARQTDTCKQNCLRESPSARPPTWRPITPTRRIPRTL